MPTTILAVIKNVSGSRRLLAGNYDNGSISAASPPWWTPIGTGSVSIRCVERPDMAFVDHVEVARDDLHLVRSRPTPAAS